MINATFKQSAWKVFPETNWDAAEQNISSVTKAWSEQTPIIEVRKKKSH